MPKSLLYHQVTVELTELVYAMTNEICCEHFLETIETIQHFSFWPILQWKRRSKRIHTHA